VPIHTPEWALRRPASFIQVKSGGRFSGLAAKASSIIQLSCGRAEVAHKAFSRNPIATRELGSNWSVAYISSTNKVVVPCTATLVSVATGARLQQPVPLLSLLE